MRGFFATSNFSEDETPIVKDKKSRYMAQFSYRFNFPSSFVCCICRRYGELELKTKEKPKATGLLIATVKHLKKPQQLLIIPVTVWLGIQEAFIGADYTQVIRQLNS